MTVDLHTHILPAVDDGAADLEQSLALLSQETENGVDTVVLTPHFQAQTQKPEEFLARRERALERLCAKAPEGLTLLVGAEVLYSQYLAGIDDLRDFCIAGTSYLLLEMPYHASFDERVFHAIERIVDEHGITPILAHIERYDAVRKSPEVLARFREYGCLFQVNAASFLNRSFSSRRFLRRLLYQGAVDVIASDCHDPDHRPVCLKRAAEVLEKEYGKEVPQELERMAKKIVSAERR